MKCSKCGFEAPIWKWHLVEKSGVSRLPEEVIKSYEKAVDEMSPYPETGKRLAKIVFRALAEHGLMPYHTTNSYAQNVAKSLHWEACNGNPCLLSV